MSEPIELEERIILAGDMATHWGVALASTHCGVFASMHYNNAWPSHKNDTRGRLLRLTVDRIAEFVLEHTDGVDYTIYEKPMTQRFHTAFVAGMHVAAFELAGERFGAIPAEEEIQPSTLKKWAADHGFAQKHQMIAAANEIAQYLIVDDNEADAVCLAAWYTERVLAKQRRDVARQLQLEAEEGKW